VFEAIRAVGRWGRGGLPRSGPLRTDPRVR